MKLLERLPVALSGMCLAIFCSNPALAQQADMPDGIQDGPPPPMEGMVEVTLDGDGNPEISLAMDPNAIQDAGMGGRGGPGGHHGMMMHHRGGWGGGRGGCGGGGHHAWLSELNLTDDQYEKFYALKNSFLDKAGPKMLELRTTERHLKDAMTQVNVDGKACRSMQDKINGLKADLASMKLDNKLAMHDVLTDVQRKQIRDWVVKGGRGMHHRPPHHMKMEEKQS